MIFARFFLSEDRAVELFPQRQVGTVTSEEEAVAKKRLAESAKGVAPQPKAPPATQPSASTRAPTAESQKAPVPKRLSLADLREAGRRRREAAA
jgi:hypothetical protein